MTQPKISPRFIKGVLFCVVSALLAAPVGGAPIFYYNFDQTSTPFTDQVGGADVTWGSGASSNADSPLGDTLGSSFSSMSADSSAAQASMPAIGTSDFSVSFWMNLTSAQSGGDANGILDMLSGSTGGGMQLLISPSNNIAIGVGGNSFVNKLSSLALSGSHFDTWTHIVVTVDRDSATGITYYVDGAAFGTHQDPTAYSGTSIVANQNLQVGSANALPLSGLIDDLAIYAAVLTPAEVAGLANGSKTPLVVGGGPVISDPPAVPTGLAANPDTFSVSLAWDANSETDLSGYRIFRKEGSGEFQLLGTTSSTQYIDNAVSSGIAYTYHIVARNTSNQDSPSGNEVVVTLDPPPPIDLSSSGQLPNIILVMSDDQGWGDAGYNGHPFVQTPAMDAMAADGYVLNRFYAAAPVCSPTRASVLTGRTAIRTKVPNHGRYMRAQEMTLAESLKGAGYVTGIFGKLHIGSGQPNSPANPSAMGFDEWVIGLNFFDNDPYLSRNGTVEQITGKGSDISMDETIDFLEAHKDGSKPMFAVVWFPSPHDPHEEAPDGPTLYTGESQAGYYREITLLDENLGRLRQYLRDEGIEQNTILWYCSDNGGLNSATAGGRGMKGSIYEGGLRVPGIIEWPARNLQGSTNVPLSTMDMYPTLLAMAGVSVDEQLPLDGVDVRSILDGSANSRAPIGFWHNFQGGQSTYSDAILQAIMLKQQNGDPLPHDAARIKKDIDEFPQFAPNTSTGWAAWNKWPWKLHRTGASTYELYNLETDPDEATDLYNNPTYTATRDEMQAELIAWQASVVGSINGADYGQSPLWLPLNRTEGTETFDADGRKRGNVENTADATSHWIGGRHNKAVQLDGIDDSVTLGNDWYYAPVGANARTMSTWLRTTGEGDIVSFGNPSTAGAAWNVSLDANGRLHLDVGSGSVTGSTDLRDGLWHHIAIALPNDGSPNTSEISLFLNGSGESTSSVVARAIRTDNSEFMIGGARTSSAGLDIDEFRFIPAAMNQTEVLGEAALTGAASQAWFLRHYGSAATIDWTSDTDGDGLDALWEYAFGGDPNVVAQIGPELNASYNPATQGFEVSFTRRIPGTHDIGYLPHLSDDLLTWDLTVGDITITPHPVLDSGLFERVTIQSDPAIAGSSRFFMRLEINSP